MASIYGIKNTINGMPIILIESLTDSNPNPHLNTPVIKIIKANR